jgi:hypothetical protein
MGRPRKQRRQPLGSAWYWRQTDCWYYTQPGTKKRMPLFDEQGQRIGGRQNKEAAEIALARAQVGINGSRTCIPAATAAAMRGAQPLSASTFPSAP